MRILGIDPGTALTGYAIIETGGALGQQIRVLDIGCIRTEKTKTQQQKLVEIAENIEELIGQWNPSHAAIERLFFMQNVTTAVTVAEARGVIVETISRKGIPCSEYLPKEIKVTVCGNGGADKKAVQKMVQLITKLSAQPKIDDAADALAVAICHAQRYPLEMLAA